MRKKAAFYFSVLSLTMPLAAFGAECLNLEKELKKIGAEIPLRSRQTVTDIRGLDGQSLSPVIRSAIVTDTLTSESRQSVLTNDAYLPVTQDGCKSVSLTVKHETLDDAGTQIYYQQLQLAIATGSNANELVLRDPALPELTLTVSRLEGERLKVVARHRATWSFEKSEDANHKPLTVTAEIEHSSISGSGTVAKSERLLKLMQEPVATKASKSLDGFHVVRRDAISADGQIALPESVTQ